MVQKKARHAVARTAAAIAQADAAVAKPKARPKAAKVPKAPAAREVRVEPARPARTVTVQAERVTPPWQARVESARPARVVQVDEPAEEPAPQFPPEPPGVSLLVAKSGAPQRQVFIGDAPRAATQGAAPRHPWSKPEEPREGVAPVRSAPAPAPAPQSRVPPPEHVLHRTVSQPAHGSAPIVPRGVSFTGRNG